MPVEQAFGAAVFRQSLSSNERVIDLGEPGTAGKNFVHGESLLGVRHQSLTLGGSWGTC